MDWVGYNQNNLQHLSVLPCSHTCFRWRLLCVGELKASQAISALGVVIAIFYKAFSSLLF